MQTGSCVSEAGINTAIPMSSREIRPKKARARFRQLTIRRLVLAKPYTLREKIFSLRMPIQLGPLSVATPASAGNARATLFVALGQS